MSKIQLQLTKEGSPSVFNLEMEVESVPMVGDYLSVDKRGDFSAEINEMFGSILFKVTLVYRFFNRKTISKITVMAQCL